MPGSHLTGQDAVTDVMIKLNGCTLDESNECQNEGESFRHGKKLCRYRSLSMPTFDVDTLPMSNSSSRESIDTSTREESPEWKVVGRLDIEPPPLTKCLSTPEIASADPSSPLPREGENVIDLDADADTTARNKYTPCTPPTHVMIRELLLKYQSHHLLGLALGKDESWSSSCGEGISLSEALDDLPVTSRSFSRSQHENSVGNAGGSNGDGGGGGGGGTANCLPRGLSSSSSLLLRKKPDKTTKLIRRTSNIFNMGKSKRSKEEMKRCQQTHSFVSVSFSNSSPCQICGKALAHKAASQCQNCLLACHDNSACFDQIEICPCPVGFGGCLTALKSPPAIPRHERVNSGTVLISPTQFGHAPNIETHQPIPSVLIDSAKLDQVMMDVHGYAANNVRQQDVTTLGLFPSENAPAPSVKRLSVPTSFESQASPMASAHSESSLSASSPATSRRPISPGSFSRWKSVADKLLNKPSSTDSHTDYDSPAEDTSTADNPSDNGRDLLSHARLLDFEPDLKLGTLEGDNWQATHDKDYLATLTSDEVKRQNNIYELIKTEKEYYTKLLIIDQVYMRGMRMKLGWSEEKIQQVFPFVPAILQLHLTFLRQLRLRQEENGLVKMIGDVLIEQFSGQRGQEMKQAYAAFCSEHKALLKRTKEKLEQDRTFRDFHKERIEQLKCKSGTFDIPSCYSFMTYRMSKYEVFVKELLKRTEESNPDHGALMKAQDSVKDFLVHVNQAMAVEDRRERLADIYKAMDPLTSATVDKETWKKHSLHDRILLYEGSVLARPGSMASTGKKPAKDLSLLVLLFSDSLVLLQEKNQKFFFAQFEDKKPPVIPLKKVVCVRARPEKTGKETTFRVIALTKGDDDPPVMYELTCTDAKESEKWQAEIESTRAPFKLATDALAMANQQELQPAIHQSQFLKIRETIAACQEKDSRMTELCQEKSSLIEKMIDYAGIARSRIHLPSLLTITEDNLAMEQTQCIIKAAFLEVEKLASLPSAFSPTNEDSSKMASSQVSSGTGVDLILTQLKNTSPVPRRHGTFNGFDGSKEAEALRNASRSTSMKDPNRSRRPPPSASNAGGMKSAHLSASDKASSLGVSSLISSSRDSCADYSSSSAISSSPTSSPRASAYLADEQAAILPSLLQLQWYLNQLADATSRQATAYQSLNAKYAESEQRLAVLEARDKKLNKHSAQLEELRNLQEAFIKEKNQYHNERDWEAHDLRRRRQELDRDTAKLKTDTEDVEKQRNAMFLQCEKLRENGLEVKLSTTPPYVQIFQCQPTASFSSSTPLPPPAQFEDRKPPHPPLHSLTAPGVYGDSQALPPLPPLPGDHRTRPLLASSQSLNPIRIPVAPPMPTVIPPSHQQLRPPSSEPALPTKHHSTFSIGNWRGSMESLVQKGTSAKEKMRSLYDGQDRVDSGLPRPNLRTTSEAKLGISNLMHLSEKTSKSAKEGALISPAEGKKKSLEKKRTFL